MHAVTMQQTNKQTNKQSMAGQKEVKGFLQPLSPSSFLQGRASLL